MTPPGSDVPTAMARIRLTLETADSSPEGAAGVVRMPREGDPDVNVARMRRRAEIDMEFHSGSDRPALGMAVRVGKRLVRRSVRWYLAPMMAQQSRFNHATLDAIEQLRLRVNQLSAELERVRGAQLDASDDRLPPPAATAAPE